eukprot:SM000001S04711  [mRNA]  locus=s1:1871941:1873974:+ [translate_table: standard]
MERLLEACLQRADAVEAALRIYYGSVPLVALVAFLPSRHCLLLRSLVLKVVLRGKLHRESPQTSAPPRWPLHQLISRAWEWSVPQSFFSHFYLLGFFWNLSVIVCLLQDASLRDSRHLEAAAQENEKVYRVPYGDWFYYVSCPHYTAEVVIYIGFLASSGCGDVTLYLLLAFVFANLIIVAVPTHAWYRQTFESYPKKRTAMIPYYL